MKRELENRIEAVELKSPDWTKHLENIDGCYLDAGNYPDEEWEELHFDDFVTAVRHRKTGEIRGYCFDRRTHEQMEADGGNLEYL